MRIVNICGYDGSICEKYPVQIDKDGFIKEQKIECEPNQCEHCHFMGEPWVRIELINEKK